MKHLLYSFKKVSLNKMIFIAMLLGLLAGLLLHQKAIIFKPLGDLFLKLITMLIIPLIVFSIVSGIAHIKEVKSPGKLGGFMFGYFFITTLIACCLGVAAAIIFKLGVSTSAIPPKLLNSGASSLNVNGAKLQSVTEVILGFIPSNIVTALANENVLQILFFMIFFGVGITLLPKEKTSQLVNFFDCGNEVVMWMMKIIMYYAPIGIFALISSSLGAVGFHLLYLFVKVILVCFLVNVIFTYGFLMLLVKFLGGFPVTKFLKTTLSMQILSFTTASSMVTLPVNMQACEKMGVSKPIYSVILSLGATVNMNGNALFYGMIAVFVAQLYHIHLGPLEYIIIIFTSIIGAVGTAGIPGPTILLIVVLTAVKLPLGVIPLLFGVDRIFDMMRTTVNCVGNASCAVIAQKFANKRNP